MRLHRTTSLSFLVLLLCFVAHAQDTTPSTDPNDQELEDLYDKYEDQEDKQNAKKKAEEQAREGSEQTPDKELTKISDLSELSAFEDVAVIQRRFFPKTNRLEMSASGLFSTNNQYFNNMGAGFRLAYYIQEKYGLEATYLMMTSAERPITKGLVQNQDIQTASLVEPKNYYGLSFKWVPFYGKVAWFQEKIIPFDIYFTPGFGITSTAAGGSESTFTLGVGQLFAITKSFAVRWDFVWDFYQTQVTIKEGGVDRVADRNQSDLFLGVGISYFIPEATYR